MADNGGSLLNRCSQRGWLKNDVIIFAGLIFARIERTAKLGARTQDVEKLGGDEDAAKTERITVTGEVEFVAFKVCCDVYRFHLVAQSDEGALGVSASDADEILGAQ